jgi:hypothetical protein
MKTLVLALVLVFSVDCFPQAPAKPSLADARKALIGKPILITDPARWYRASAPAVASVDVFRRLPFDYRNKRAVVLAIEPTKGRSGKNALGEEIDDTSLRDLMSYLIVRFEDGTFGATSSSPSLFLTPYGALRSFRLLEEDAKRRAIISAELQRAVGTKVYAVAYSELFKIDSSLDDLVNENSAQRARAVPRLAPLSIVAANFDASADLIILKLVSETNQQYLAISQIHSIPRAEASFREELLRGPALISEEFLRDLSAKEVSAIKTGTVFVGMSETSLAWSVGFANRKNDWGRGGKQYVYDGGRLFVYLDANNRVVNWQRFER